MENKPEVPAKSEGHKKSHRQKTEPSLHQAGRKLRNLLRARPTFTHLIVAVLCFIVGYSIVTQVKAQQEDPLSTMREDDLVRLLDIVTTRNESLVREQQDLQDELTRLRSSASSREAAIEAAADYAKTTAVMAGTVPVKGPGIVITIKDPGERLPAQVLVTMLSELRNAGAEAIELSNHRLGVSSWIERRGNDMVVDEEVISSPYVWSVIGDAPTILGALNIHGGVLSIVKSHGGELTTEQFDEVKIETVRDIKDPIWANPSS